MTRTSASARRRSIATRFLFALALFVCANASKVCADDWPQWRGPDGRGRIEDAGFAESWSASEPKSLWSRPLGGGYAGIAVVGDKAITLDRQTQPQEIERVLCVNLADGETVWSHEYSVAYDNLDYGNGPRACPTIVGDRVYTLGALGHLRCLNLADGGLIWEKHFEKDFQGRRPTWGYAASPLIVNDRVIIQPGGDNDRSVMALNADTGDVVWSSLSDEAGYTWPVVIESGGLSQLICWTPSHIRGVELTTGKPLWEIPYEVQYGVSIATPIFEEGLVLVCGYWNGSKAIRLGESPTDALLEWEENRYLRGLMSQPLYRDGLVYLLDKQYGLTCFELATGKKLWDDENQLTPRGRNPQASLGWIGNTDRILSLNANGELIQARINREGYTELGRQKIIGETWAHPAFSGKRVLARSDSELVCIELP